MRRPGLLVLILFILGTSANAQLCSSWNEGERIGELESPINEASGLAISRRYQRLYHINDSGDGPHFYITGMNGAGTRKVTIRDFKPTDVEALGFGNCGGGKSCLFIGDIGDNDANRKSLEIAVIEELERFPEQVTVKETIRIRYPDGSHDAESMAIHPDGTIYILTKDLTSRNGRRSAGPVRLFKLPAMQWQRAKGVQTLTAVSAMDFRRIFPNGDAYGQSPTDMDISPDGKRLLVLTYRNAVEFELADLSKYQRITLSFLQQQEAVAYVPGTRAFIYTTEQTILPAWMMRAACR